jgi:hypothetical protein
MARWNHNFFENGGLVGVPVDLCTDPFLDYLVCAFTGEGANGAKPATDMLGRGLSWVGSGQIVTTASSKWYGSGLWIDSSGDNRMDWVNNNTIGRQDCEFCGWFTFMGQNAGNGPPWGIFGGNGGSSFEISMGPWQLAMSQSGNTGNNLWPLAWHYMGAGVPHFIVVGRKGSISYASVNGQPLGNRFNAINYQPGQNGVRSNGAGGTQFVANDLRFYIGANPHGPVTGAFQPPQRPYRDCFRKTPSGIFHLG